MISRSGDLAPTYRSIRSWNLDDTRRYQRRTGIPLSEPRRRSSGDRPFRESRLAAHPALRGGRRRSGHRTP
jgi:hypothetical protein